MVKIPMIYHDSVVSLLTSPFDTFWFALMHYKSTLTLLQVWEKIDLLNCSGSCTKFLYIMFVKSSLCPPSYSQITNVGYLHLNLALKRTL